jgi:hypothetical protein
MTAQTTDTMIAKLESVGGSRWTKGGMDRMYFELSDLLGITIDTYKSGNIASATRNGATISNSKAGKFLEGKIWYDLADGTIHTQTWSNPLIDEAREALKARIEAM